MTTTATAPMSAVRAPRRTRRERTPDAALTLADRAAAGRAARAAVPRSAHAALVERPDRPDPVELLQEQGRSRVPELVPIRYGRMAASPFAFYRGAALGMASDLAHTPVSGLTVQACGDAHLMNFGVYASPERRLVFDVNDFDESVPGPWEWDVKRLAASLAVAGRERQFTTKQRARVVAAAVSGYRLAMRQFAGMSTLAVWYSALDTDELLRRARAGGRGSLGHRTYKSGEKQVRKAATRNNLQAAEKLTTVVDGRLQFVPQPPIVERLVDLMPDAERDQLETRLSALVTSYGRRLPGDRRRLLEQFRVVDMARKVVGVGSVGTRCWILLLIGRDSSDPLILQAKEAQESVLERFVGASSYATCGERVVVGQRLMQATSDIFLGWDSRNGIDGEARDFYVRQLRDGKGSADLTQMVPEGMAFYGATCGWTLARAHARSGDRIAIATYLGSSDAFDRAIGEFAETYADQNERDHAALVQAIVEGRVTAERGV
jgi:uncharacterized protein (DUF2252 family)